MSDAMSAMQPRSVLRRSMSESASAMMGNEERERWTTSSVMSEEPCRSSGSVG